MLRLILMRHAQAADAKRDFERPLSQRGRVDAQAAGRRLALGGFSPQAALVSSAQRTRETLQYCLQGLDSADLPANFTKELYNAYPKNILTEIHKLDKEFKTVLLIAHNPGISELAGELSIEPRYYGFSPSDWCLLEFEGDDWAELSLGREIAHG